MKIAVIKNSLFIVFYFLSFNIFSQNKIYTSPDLPNGWNDYRIFYKTDKKSKLKIFLRIFLVENEKAQDDFEKCDRVIQFLKKDNPFLASDFKIIRTCIGFSSSGLNEIQTLTKDKYFYLKLYYS